MTFGHVTSVQNMGRINAHDLMLQACNLHKRGQIKLFNQLTSHFCAESLEEKCCYEMTFKIIVCVHNVLLQAKPIFHVEVVAAK